MTLDPTALSVAVGATSPIKASVTPENATNKVLNWASGDEAIATVVGLFQSHSIKTRRRILARISPRTTTTAICGR
ncbi:Ig-like domain-containing protein [Cronobacter sakazakii]|nr:Ig-like domain-containing protein [Cronobacter sakazakii]